MDLDFIVAGATRSGTSTLYKYLQYQSGVCLSRPKETRYFDNPSNVHRNDVHYKNYFKHCSKDQLKGEVAPSYFWKWPSNDFSDEFPAYQEFAGKLIEQKYPDLKIIFTLRDPIERAFSQYKHNLTKHRISQSFSTLIKKEIKGQMQPSQSPYCFLHHNDYLRHLNAWRNYFDRENMLILIFERWISNPSMALRKIGNFIGCNMDRLDSENNIHKNETLAPEMINVKNVLSVPYQILEPLAPSLFQPIKKFILKVMKTREPKMDSELRTELGDYFVDRIHQLEREFQLDLSVWRED